MKRLFFLVFILCISWNAAAKEIFPKGCIPHALQDEYITLNTEKPLIVMLHNLSDKKIWITHVLPSHGAQAGWSSSFDAGQWSALAFSQHKKHFTLSCIESQPGHEQQISCADVMAVCEWPQSQFPKDKSGTFWAAENMDMLPLKAYLERRGFRLTE